MEDAAWDVALALAAVGDLYLAGALSIETVEQLRAAARTFVADDLRPRPPLDLEADRVDPGALSGGPVPSAPPSVGGDAGGAAVIPIRG